MTCIVALMAKGKVYMAGDSAGVAGLNLMVRNDSKVFSVGPFVMGFTSSFRMGNLLQYSFKVPEQTKNTSDREYMSTAFINSVRECLKEGGYVSTDKGQESGGTFLVGYKGQIYIIADDFQVGVPADDFAAVGCGGNIALGAMYVSSKISPEERVLNALAAAERFSAGVRAPFRVVKSG